MKSLVENAPCVDNYAASYLISRSNMTLTSNCKNNFNNLPSIREAILTRLAYHRFEFENITEWRAINGLPYQISDTGSIKSLKRNKHRLLVPTLSNNKYFYITLTINGKRKGFAVDRLMIMVFHNIPYNKIKKVIHLDNIRHNNQLKNLSYTLW